MHKVFFLANNITSKNERGVLMAKAGMRRPDPSDPHGTESNKKNKINKNTVEPVAEINGKAKTGNKKVEE